MKAVVLVFAVLFATAAVVRASEAEAEAETHAAVESEAEADMEFNTHDADALEVDLSGSDELELETDTTTEAELVDSDEELAEEDEEDDAEAEDEAEDEAEEEGEAEAAAEVQGKADTAVVAAAEHAITEGNTAELETKKCAPTANPTCPNGKAVFSTVTHPASYNGCGADGAKILNDKVLGGKFTPCCNNHDLCYGAKSVGQAAKDTCDTNFYNCMTATCAGGILCKSKAWVYYQAVSVGGCGAWNAAKLKQGC